MKNRWHLQEHISNHKDQDIVKNIYFAFIKNIDKHRKEKTLSY